MYGRLSPGFLALGGQSRHHGCAEQQAIPPRAPHRRSSVLCAGKQTHRSIRELREAHQVLDVRLKSQEPRILLFPVEDAVSSHIESSSSRAPSAWCPIGAAIFSCWFSFQEDASYHQSPWCDSQEHRYAYLSRHSIVSCFARSRREERIYR